MASTKIRGITIELNADTAGIMDGLKDVNKSLGSTEKALKDVNKLLKFDDGNTELITQQQKYLEQAIAECTTKLEKEKELLSALQQADNASETTEQQKALAREIAATEQKLNGYKNTLNEANDKLDDFGDETKQAGSATLTLGDIIKANLASDALIAGIKALANGIREITEASLEVGSSFESAMSQVAATMGMTSQDVQNNIDSYKTLTDSAREMGRATMFSATEAAEALNYLALAGYDAEKAAATLPKVLTLAAAGDMDLAYASDLVTDAMAAMGMETSELDNYIDQMTRTAQKSNTSVSQLGEATLVCAGAVKLTGQDLVTMNTELGILANNGIKGAEGGTHLRNVLLSLSAPTDKASDQMKALGLNVKDSEGNMRNLNDIMIDLNRALDGMGSVDKAAAIKTIFNKTDIAAVNALLKGTNEEYNKLSGELMNCKGAAEEMATVMQDNLKGKVTILKSALESLGITFFDVFDDTAKDAVDSATDAVGQLEDAITNGELGVSLRDLSAEFDKLATEMINWAMDALPGFIDGLTSLLKNMDLIIAGLEGAAAGYIAYEAASLVATIATQGFTAALNVNPIVLLTTAIVGLGTAFLKLGDAAEEEANKLPNAINESKEALDNLEASYATNSTSAQTLASKIKELNSIEKLTSAQQLELASAVEQWNSVMDENNQLVLDNTGHVVDNTGALEDNIDAALELYEIGLKQQELTEIVEQYAEAQKNLEEAQRGLNEAAAEYTEIERDGSVTHSMALSTMQEAQQTYDEAKETVKEYSDRYATLVEEIEAGTAAQEESVAAMEAETEAAELEAAAIEELTEKLENMQSTIASSIQSSLDLTSAWTQDWDTSTAQMTENIQSQIDGIQNWADNFETLANASDVAINQEVLEYLANLGVEGAGLVQELVDTLNESPEELEAWAETMQEYLSLDEEVSEEIVATYTDTLTQIAEEGVAVVEDEMPAINEAMVEQHELMQEDATDNKDKMTQITVETITSMTQAVTDNTPTFLTAVEKLQTDAIAKCKEVLQITGEGEGARSAVFYNIGMTIDESLAAGITDGTSLVTAAMVSMCEAAVAAIDVSGLASKIDAAIASALA